MQNYSEKFKIGLNQRAYEYSVRMIKFIDQLSANASSQVIVKQLIRSSTSIGANIIEAQSASSKKDFTNYFVHSLKSANESVYWLNLLREASRISGPEIEYLTKETGELANIIAASILTLKGKR